MKVLFVGNSYTYYNDLPVLFQTLCLENGKTVEVCSVTSGGRYLRQNLDQEDETTLKFRDLLENHHFDVCVLQEQSTYPIRDRESFLRDILRIAQYIRPHTDRFVLYATWGRQFGSKILAELGMTSDAMAEALSQAYSEARLQIAANAGLPADISQVGFAFSAMNRLPESNLYNPDLSHPSYEGSCLSAMVHYKTVFGAAPASAEQLHLDPEVTNRFLSLLQTM